MKNAKKSTPPTPPTPPAPPSFTREELVVINNALNEVCHALNFSDDEFQTRIGFSRAFAQGLLKKTAKLLER
jgi:hypothetical protein